MWKWKTAFKKNYYSNELYQNDFASTYGEVYSQSIDGQEDYKIIFDGINVNKK